MRVSLTERQDASGADLRPAMELAPDLALPWVAKLRYGVLAGEAALILAAHFLLDLQLPLGWLALPLAATAATNLALHRFSELFSARPALGLLLAFDTLCLTALLALTGGPANPFSLLYLVQITLSAIVLSKAWTWGLGLLSAGCYGLLFPAHVPLALFEGHQHGGDGFSAHLVGMWIAFAAGAFLITVFIGKVSEALRKREQEVFALQGRLARQDRLASAVTLAAGAAHELGTPLGTIAVASKDLEYYATQVSRDADVAGEARLIRAEVERCRGILQQMSARGAEPVGEAPVEMDVGEVLDRLKAELPAGDSGRVETRVAPGAASAVLPPDATRQALAALVRNALDAAPGGRVAVTAERGAGMLRFTVQDWGCGMDAATLNRLAEPFFTTKQPGHGMGLGTFLVRAFAGRMNGSLSFESERGAGTRAILELPLTDHDRQREPSGADRR